MAFTKPNVNFVWASTGGVIKPADAKINQGWIAEIPDFEFENWIQNRQDQFNAHINQYGIPVWDTITEYQANKSYVQGSDGNVYKALTTNTNVDPVSNPSDWTRAFNSFGASYTKSESDNKYLTKSNNLSDLSSTPTARTNLSVYSKTESDGKYQLFANLTGMIAPFAGDTPPSGWLKCNGAAISRSTYIALFNQIGTTYGSGDGSTTFNLPDLRGEFIRGWDDGRGIDTGRAIGSFQADELKSHNHTGSTNSAGSHSHSGSTTSAGSHTHGSISGYWSGNDGGFPSSGSNTWRTGAAVQATAGVNNFSMSSAGNHSHSLSINSAGSHSHTVTIGSTGGSETRPRNIAMLYCIKA